MNREILLCDVSDSKCALTGVMEEGDGSWLVRKLFRQPFYRKDDVMIISQSWDMVLMDLLIGTQLHNYRFSGKTTLSITVFADPKKERVVLSGLAGEMVSQALEKQLLQQFSIRRMFRDPEYPDAVSRTAACAKLQNGKKVRT